MYEDPDSKSIAKTGGGSSFEDSRSSQICRASVALLGYFNLMWFGYWLVTVNWYDSIVVGPCIEIPNDSHAYMACGALYCANRIADLVTGLVLLIGIHMKNPTFLQAFVMYEMFTFTGWLLIFLLYWTYSENWDEEGVHYTLFFILYRLCQLFCMYVVMALKKDMALEREEQKQVRFYI